MTGACRSFLRRLSDHIDDRIAGRPVEHVRECPGCARLLDAAKDRRSLLAARPPVPARLHSPAFLTEIFERTVAASEQGHIGDLLESGLAATRAPEETWPEVELEHEVGVAAAAPAHAPSWLWARVHAQVSAEIHARRAARRRWFLAGSAAGILIAVGSILGLFAQSDGTSDLSEIVFERVSEPPAGFDYSPVLALRQGGIR